MLFEPVPVRRPIREWLPEHDQNERFFWPWRYLGFGARYRFLAHESSYDAAGRSRFDEYRVSNWSPRTVLGLALPSSILQYESWPGRSPDHFEVSISLAKPERYAGSHHLVRHDWIVTKHVNARVIASSVCRKPLESLGTMLHKNFRMEFERVLENDHWPPALKLLDLHLGCGSICDHDGLDAQIRMERRRGALVHALVENGSHREWVETFWPQVQESRGAVRVSKDPA